MSNFYELQPAYGRDYKTAKEVTDAFNNNRDFVGDFQLGFSFVNKEQLEKPYTVILRYSTNMKVASVSVK